MIKHKKPQTILRILRGKQSGFALPLAILIVIVLIAGGGTGYYFYKTSSAEKYSSPEKTYSLYIKAMEEGDVEAYLECFTKESQEMLRPDTVLERLTPERLKTVFEFHKEAEFKVTEKTSDTAVMAPETAEANVLVFGKEKENWKIDLTETFLGEKGAEEKLSEEEKKEEAKKFINEALLKIEKVKSEEDPQKLQLLISEAIEYGKNAVELDPRNPKILFQMGNIYFEIKEMVSDADVWARSYYKKALGLDPNNPVYQEKLRKIQPQDD